MTTKNELTEEQIKGSYFDYTLKVEHLTLKNAHSFGMKAGFELGRKAQWVSVEDRLPEDEEAVLVCLRPTPLRLETEKENHLIIQAAYDSSNGIWYDFQSEEDIDTDLFLVTDWMPLPEPPGE